MRHTSSCCYIIDIAIWLFFFHVKIYYRGQYDLFFFLNLLFTQYNRENMQKFTTVNLHFFSFLVCQILGMLHFSCSTSSRAQPCPDSFQSILNHGWVQMDEFLTCALPPSGLFRLSTFTLSGQFVEHLVTQTSEVYFRLQWSATFLTQSSIFFLFVILYC